MVITEVRIKLMEDDNEKEQLQAFYTADSQRPRGVQTKHTPECLAERLEELEPILFTCFPAYAAECGLTAAEQAGLNYIRRVEVGEEDDLDDGETYLRLAAFREGRTAVKEKTRVRSLFTLRGLRCRKNKRTRRPNMKNQMTNTLTCIPL